MSVAHHRAAIAWVLSLAVSSAASAGGDWPCWRYDSQRSAASPGELPARLQVHWVRELPKLKPAWPDQPKMQFDAAYEPIVSGQRLFIGSSHDNSVTAYETRTGDEIWRFFADGPVRFAPLAWRENLYFVSDDGCAYCLRAQDGALVWRFRGGPSERRILGNERLVSAWPARGAPVIAEGKLYFAAGIWPFMGIFLHALDAETGRVLWTNDGDGSIYIKQPHNSDSFAGVAPQGALVVIGDKLLIPGGRSVPACYDRATGRLLYYRLAENGKLGGGSTVAAVDSLLLNGGAAFDLQTEHFLGAIGEQLTIAAGQLHAYRNQELRALDLHSSMVSLQDAIDRKGVKTKVAKWSIREVGRGTTPRFTSLIRAGSRLIAGSEGRVLAYSLPLPVSGTLEPAWQIEIEGTPLSLVSADDRLFAVTSEGRIICYGDSTLSPSTPTRHPRANQPLGAVGDDAGSSKARAILASSGVRDGYCVVHGLGNGGLVRELIQHSTLRIVVTERDESLVTKFRGQLREAGIGGERVTLVVTDPLGAQLPPYLASLSIIESLPSAESDRAALIATTYAGLRPFGGVACLPISTDRMASLSDSMKNTSLAGAVWKPAGEMTMLVREGALPESADWTHEHADASNTRVSKDRLVKTPLGVLWFGGPTNDAILPRHGHGPQPQVVEGRLFIEGVDLLRATDIYTGRVLWESRLPGLGTLYDNTAHQPGANASGTNYIATPDGIYVAFGKSCVRLDPATGQQTDEFKLPMSPGKDAAARSEHWGYINVFENYLVGGVDPLFDPSLTNSRGENDNYSSSRRLVVLDRRSGEVLWSADATSGFRHNAVCIGGGRMYCIDRMSGPQLARLKRRGESPLDKPRLVVFDLQSGRQLWNTERDVFGTWLSYSAERDVLVEAGRVASDSIADEPKGMRAYRATDGSMLWENKTFAGPAMIHHDTILMAGKACDLLTGAPRLREHPLSGEPVEWSWSRNYGCNTPMASEHLLTFRSGAAGYFDYCHDGGTGNFGGFRSSCSNNLIVAGGLLNAPEYTRTCVCSYQNQTSLALVHMPEVETWTSFGAQTPKQRVRRLGINLAAPGDRKSEDGTLWLDYPSVGGDSPVVSVTTVPPEPTWFRRHSSRVGGSGLPWVAASGAIGLTSLKIKLAEADSQPRRYTVRLYFVEPDEIQFGERVFHVKVQGQSAIDSLDVAREAGGAHRAVVKELAGVEVGQDLVIELTPDPQAKHQATVLCGVELQAEGW